MSLEELKTKIETCILTVVQGSVEIEDTPVGNVHVLVEADRFDGLSYAQRDRLIWPALETALTEDELLRISVCVLSASGEQEALAG